MKNQGRLHMGYNIVRQGFKEGNSRLGGKRRAKQTPPGKRNLVGLGTVAEQQSCGKRQLRPEGGLFDIRLAKLIKNLGLIKDFLPSPPKVLLRTEAPSRLCFWKIKVTVVHRTVWEGISYNSAKSCRLEIHLAARPLA